MAYQGRCHCGAVAFRVEGAIGQAMDCNCSFCRRRGALLWFVPKSAFTLETAASRLGTYTFNTHKLQHHFCPTCGIAPFSEGENAGQAMVAVNVRCLEGIALGGLTVVAYDGASR